eukprot:732997-Pyramimonas_sp.AAC.1
MEGGLDQEHVRRSSHRYRCGGGGGGGGGGRGGGRGRGGGPGGGGRYRSSHRYRCVPFARKTPSGWLKPGPGVPKSFRWRCRSYDAERANGPEFFHAEHGGPSGPGAESRSRSVS